MSLGAFSVALAVKGIAISRALYEQLGFKVMAGNQAHGYLIMADQPPGSVCFRACSKPTP